MAKTQGSHGRQDIDVRDTDQWEGHEGDPTAAGAKWLNGLLALVAIAWVVAIVQIFRLPGPQEVRVNAESAIWMAVACSAGISTFILLIWKVHRA